VTALVDQIADRIRRAGPISFAEFMDSALYHPEHGYYGSGRVGIGGEGADYRTSPEVDPIFGEMLCRQVAEMYRRLGRPEPFRVVELGPGTGRLARSLLSHVGQVLPGEIGAWEYHLVERSPALLEAQQDGLSGLPEELRSILRWSSPEDLHSGPAVGVVLSNEFFDALPVERVQMLDGRLQELRVSWSAERGLFTVREPPLDGSLASYFEHYGAPLEEGQEAEACLEALSWVDRVAGFLARGYCITIDYGDLAEGLYGPTRRRGTLLSYRDHTVVDDPFSEVGLQDLTAHVNFTALVQRGEEHRWVAAPLRSQTEFLLSLGILDRMEERDQAAAGEVERWRGRLAARELFVPGGMGETFRVLIQARDAPLEGLAGLGAPWRSDTF
jgi:SAM-dependent MidA family methyltransferase